MAWIYLPPKKVYKRAKTESKRGNSNHDAVYNSVTWKKLRLEKLKKNPLCEVCLKRGKVESARDVHHITPIGTVESKQAKQVLGFDFENLQSLCKQCHKDQHK